MDTFHKCTWDNELGGKKKFYIEEFNPTHNHQQKSYIGVNISRRPKILIAQLKLSEIGSWKRPNNAWGEEYVFFALLEKWKQKGISF